ncbi:MAG TPA: DNA-processing protein DprA, partial [Candidatus Caenarcaniphilales bacterium]|nr:DNA-processing protein DprA [Candidatus Caenarcaniphilales bacterium]
MRPEHEREAWLVLASAPGVGDESFGRLLGVFGSALDVLDASGDGRLRAASIDWQRRTGRPLITAPVLAGIRSVAVEGARRLDRVKELGLWSVTPLDGDYPERLRSLDPPPAVIYGWGDPTALSGDRAVAVVGTRRPTAAGRMLAGQICSRLVECCAVVVSGLAVGIDGAAHAAVVERHGQTVGVIGAGHDQPGPRAHDRLRREILDNGGAIVGEHHP